ncbi:MAG: hypothetical protein M3280_05315 [Actinomycetota bacterium]|nr:hypothetical protein [Actinomycetota bacterium]
MAKAADDVRLAARISRDALESAVDLDWSVAAGSLEWDCRTTAGHISDALGFYAAHLAVRSTQWLKFDVVPHVDASNGHLARLIPAMAEVLAQVIEAAPQDARGYHHSGMHDRDTMAAMGCLEALVHTGDIAAGLELSFEVPQELCQRVVGRLFPSAPRDPDRWSVLWWATGRGDLAGQPRLGADWGEYWLRAVGIAP